MPRRSNRTIIDAQVARFEEAGADPGVVRRLLDLLKSSPQQRQLAAGRQTGVNTAMRDASQTLDEAGERWRPLYELSKAPIFATYSETFQDAVHRELRAIGEQLRAGTRALLDSLRRMAAADPWLNPILDVHRHKRRRGRPSYALPDLFMLVMTAHLQERTGHRHYALVGEVTRHLFPKALDATDLGEAVRVRISTFRRKYKYNVPQLLAAITRQPC